MWLSWYVYSICILDRCPLCDLLIPFSHHIKMLIRKRIFGFIGYIETPSHHKSLLDAALTKGKRAIHCFVFFHLSAFGCWILKSEHFIQPRGTHYARIVWPCKSWCLLGGCSLFLFPLRYFVNHFCPEFLRTLRMARWSFTTAAGNMHAFSQSLSRKRSLVYSTSGEGRLQCISKHHKIYTLGLHDL